VPPRGDQLITSHNSKSQVLVRTAQQSRNSLPAIGALDHIFVGCQDLCVFFPSLILLIDKEEGVGLFFPLGVSLLHLSPRDVTLLLQ
jgi:hypothetical protein